MDQYERPKEKVWRLDDLAKKAEEQEDQVYDEAVSEQPVDNDNPIEFLENPPKRKPGRPLRSYGPTSKKDKVTLEKATKTLWRKSMLSWKLDKAQKDMYDSYHNRTTDLVVWVVCRQAIGKSYCANLIAIEEALRKPNLRIAYISPQKSQTRDVVEKNTLNILQDCPENLRPKWDTMRSMWVFKNGSMIKVAGIDGGHIESLRGQTFDIVMVDEAGFPSAEEFVYAMESVVFPTMTRAARPIMLMFSTPPVNYDHPFNDYWDRAQLSNSLVFKTLYDSCQTKAQIQSIEDRLGKDSIGFRREYMCERLADTTKLVVPEANKEKMVEIVKEWQRPPFFKTYVSADYGVMDLNAILFGYYDFRASKLIIEDELLLKGEEYDTDKMAKVILAKEKELWNTEFPPARYCDNNLQIIRDFANMNNLIFLASGKDGKQAAVNEVRMRVNNSEIIINPKCVNLINHLQNAVWDKKRQSFRRALDHHYDFLDALIYMVRNVDYNHNPYPAGYMMQGKFISKKNESLQESNETANMLFNRLFGRLKK